MKKPVQDGASIKAKFSEFVAITKEAFRHWRAHRPTHRGSALAFLTIFPLPSLLMVMIIVFGQLYGQAAALDRVIQEITTLAGPTVADLFRQLLENARNPFATVFVAIISIPFFIIGIFAVFGELENSLNTIWDVVPGKHRSFREMIRAHTRPFLLITGLGIMVTVWTAITTVLFTFIRLTVGPSMGASILLEAADVLLSFILVTLLLAVIYKQLPDTEISWSDVTVAAVLAALLFTISKYIFEIYIQAFVTASVYGAAGSLLLLLLWIFLSAQFLLFGAEFSNVYAERKGSRSEHVKSIQK